MKPFIETKVAAQMSNKKLKEEKRFLKTLVKLQWLLKAPLPFVAYEFPRWHPGKNPVPSLDITPLAPQGESSCHVIHTLKQHNLPLSIPNIVPHIL